MEDLDLGDDFTHFSKVASPSNTTVVDQDMNVVLDYLMELHRLDNTSNDEENHELDVLAIENAARINDQMQQHVKKQIMEIDKKMEENTKLLGRIREAAILEYRALKKVKIHQRYKNNINYFPDVSSPKPNNLMGLSESEEEDVEEEEEEEEEDEEVNEEDIYNNEDNSYISKPAHKAWSRAERKRLAEGIHATAQYGIVKDFQEKQEEWKIWDLENIPKEELEKYPVEKINWHKISVDYVKTRSWIECLIQWTTQEHPTINKLPWGKLETEKLKSIVQEKGEQGRWEDIASELGTNRTISQCFSHYMAYKNNVLTKRKFTKEEDIRLANAVKIFGSWNWQQIASMMENRTGQQCLHRWTKTLDPSIVRRNWTAGEDKLLKETIKLYGAGNWRKIQRFIPGRTDTQCRERWMNILDPTINRDKFTQEDYEQLNALVEEHGTKWSYIATFFPGRTDNFVMKQYKAYKKSISQKDKEQLPKERNSKKRRGRPPKENQVLSENNEGENGIDDNESTPSPKKRRGRPRKSGPS